MNVQIGDGWYFLEGGNYSTYRWMGSNRTNSTIILNNYGKKTNISLKLHYGPYNTSNNLSIFIDDVLLSNCTNNYYCEIDGFNLSSGTHVLKFELRIPSESPNNGDPRYLGYSFSNISVFR